MKVRSFRSEQWLARPLDEVFEFFSDAHNLQRLTPPWLDFEVLTPAPIAMAAGTRIDYRLKVRGVPLRWRSEIELWEPPVRFVDVQLRGPYRMWHHTHRFEATDGGTRVTDEVRYAVWGGALIDRLFVRPDVRRIFDYRRRELERLFGRAAA